nr:olfactory receptor 107 [Microplitis mediator]
MRNEMGILGTVPDSTEQSQSDIKYSTEMNRWFLQPIGIWPASSNIFEKIISKILVIVCYFLICFLLIPCGLHTFLNEKDPRLKMKMIGPLSFCLMAISKYCFLVMRKKQIRECLKHIYVDWRRVRLPADRTIMLINAKIGRFIASLSAVFMYSGGFFYHTIMPLSAGNFITPDNITIRPLTYPVYAPLFAALTSPSYEIVFTIQWFSGFVLYSITIGACSLAAIFVLHTCGQLKIVMSRLENLIEDNNKKFTDSLDNRIAEIVQIHLRALNFIVRTEKILNEVCLIEFVGCTMNICFLGYYFMTEFERAETIATVTYCVLLVSFTFNIFILCYIGEMLTQQGIKVGLTAYTINWYELSGKKAKDLILLLAMSNYPNSITAGKMAELSYNSFCGVLKSAAAYLNLLRTAIL